MRSYSECLDEINSVAHDIDNANPATGRVIHIYGLELAQDMTSVELQLNPGISPLGNLNEEIDISLKKKSTAGFQHFLISKSAELLKREAAVLYIFSYVPPWPNQTLPNIGGVGKEQYDYLDSSHFWGPIRSSLGLVILNNRGMNRLASEMTPIREKYFRK